MKESQAKYMDHHLSVLQGAPETASAIIYSFLLVSRHCNLAILNNTGELDDDRAKEFVMVRWLTTLTSLAGWLR